MLWLGAKATTVLLGRRGERERQSGEFRLLFLSKSPEMASFGLKTGVFRGALFTTKVIGLPSISSCKIMIQEGLCL